MHQVCSTLNRGRPFAPLVLRVVLGGLFIWHGIDKFDTGISMIEDMFSMWGVPVPELTAPLTAIVEIVAGAMLVLGFGTRIAAMALSVVSVGALIYVKSEPVLGARIQGSRARSNSCCRRGRRRCVSRSSAMNVSTASAWSVPAASARIFARRRAASR